MFDLVLGPVRFRYLSYIFLIILLMLLDNFVACKKNDDVALRSLCVPMSDTLKARHKTCFLRPDTGPCRADIIQWYFDARQEQCYRFFWGGCQGNGNKFETKEDCLSHCYINGTNQAPRRPFYCELTFDYGTCFGHYDRWTWDKLYGTCKRRVYSGCGGNQNNFETLEECVRNCLQGPDDTLGSAFDQYTTCMPLGIPQLQRRRKRRR